MLTRCFRPPFLFLLLGSTAWGVTINATSCARTGAGSIGAAITSATAGDTVIGPSGGGSSTWSGGKVIRTGGIIIDGGGCDITFASSGADIDITLDSHTLEIKNFTFEGATGNNDGQVIIRGLTPSTATCKIHDNIFKNGDGELATNGHGDCVIYKNSFTSAVSGSQSLVVYGANAGDYTPRTDDQLPQSAGGKIVTIEGNTFTNTNAGTYGQIQAYYGGSFVFRYNELYNVGIETHGSSPGTCAGENGARWLEIYLNNHHPTVGITVPLKLRGGTGVVYGNTSTIPDNLILDEDCTTTTLGWPIQAQVGQGIEPAAASGTTVSDPTKWSPLYAWNNSGFAISVSNTYFIKTATTANACTHTGNAATNAGTKCDAVVTTTQPSSLLRCESSADVTAGCPVSYTYTPYTCPHPATGTGGVCTATSGTAGYTKGATLIGGVTGSGYNVTGGYPYGAAAGTVTLPTTWVNSLEWMGTTSNTISFPVTFTALERRRLRRRYFNRYHRWPTRRWMLRNERSGGGWTCPGTSTTYPNYTAGSAASLNQAVADAENCRSINGTGSQINIPAGAVFSTATVNLINLPQTAGDTSTNFIVLTSTSPLPTARTVCSHGIQDNVSQSTQPGLRNVGCNGTNLSYTLGVTPTTVASGSSFTFANGTVVTNPGATYNDVASMYELDGGNNQIDTVDVSSLCPGVNCMGPHHFAILNAHMHPHAGQTAVQAPVAMGTGSETTTSQLPSHIHFLYNYIHGDWQDPPISGGVATGTVQGFNTMPNQYTFHCVYCSVSYSYADQSLRPGAEGHGISILLGQHIKIVHNWFEGQAIGHLCGGFAAPITIPNFMVCDDMEDRGNRYTYPISWSLAWDKGYQPNSFYQATGGAGSGAVIHLMSTNGPPNNQSAQSFEIINGGSGYALNDVLTLTNTYDPTASGATVVVTARGAGNSVSTALMASGSSYSVASGVATTCASPYCGSSGSGATVNITSVSPTGKITGVTLASGGSGYAASDNVKISGGDGQGMVGVTTISSGVITGIQVVSGTTYHINSYVQKNRHEYKFSSRIVLDGNIFEGGEFSGGQGQAISFKANQTSAVIGSGSNTNYWTTQNNSTITNNIMRTNCAAMSGGFRSDLGNGGGGGNSDTVANYYYVNNLMYNINISNPGCQASIAFSTRIASSSAGVTWTGSTLTRSSNVVTVALNGSDVAANGQGRFHVGDYVRVTNCSPDTSFQTGDNTTLGTKAIAGTIPASLTVVYPSVGANGTSTCDVSNNQGTPDHFWADHNSEFGQSTVNAAQSPSSPLVSPATKPCAMATNNHWVNILSTSGGPNAPPVGEGDRSETCMWDVGTLNYNHIAVPSRDVTVTCPGHSAGAGGIAACYSQWDNGAKTLPITTIWGDATEYCTTNDPVTENCIGIVGEMSTSTFNYILSNWHDYRLCHGEAACNGKTSKYAAGQSNGGTDGDMGVKSFSAIDAAETASQYCVPNCSIGSFPDHP